MPIINVWKIKGREFGKISEKDLTVKDFSCPEALGGVSRRVTVGGILGFQLRLILNLLCGVLKKDLST